MLLPLRPLLLALALLLLPAGHGRAAEDVPLSPAQPAQPPAQDTAEAAFRRGYALQQERRTLEALDAFAHALKLDPAYGPAHYEIGWSYWILGDWPQVVKHWEEAQRLKGGPPELPDYLREARARQRGEGPAVLKAALHTRAAAPAADGLPPLALELVARFQHYDPAPADPADVFDAHVFSPKSVIFSPDGAKAYVNALEGEVTIVYDARALRKRSVIMHRFGPDEAGLFDSAETQAFRAAFKAGHAPDHPNRFKGKPVESAFTHGGRYLWVSYYRRDYDRDGVLPAAVAIVDTATDRIVRVMHTGPIAKFLAVSPDGRTLAVIHWGDNTVGLIDVSAAQPKDFRHAGEIVVGTRLPLPTGRHVDRDRYCGFCLRGAVFTADGRHLLVGRMGGGGIAVLDVAARKHIGTVQGMRPTPRHLVLSPDGARLYVGSNVGGYVSVYRTADLVAAAQAHRATLAPLIEARTGSGTRTLALAPDGLTLYAAVNRESQIVALEAATLAQRLEIAVDSFPVGLAVSPRGDQLWSTSQGVHLAGGNSVSVYTIEGGK
jgi:DNA-binding beta-propeller fold protein YncE